MPLPAAGGAAPATPTRTVSGSYRGPVKRPAEEPALVATMTGSCRNIHFGSHNPLGSGRQEGHAGACELGSCAKATSRRACSVRARRVRIAVRSAVFGRAARGWRRSRRVWSRGKVVQTVYTAVDRPQEES